MPTQTTTTARRSRLSEGREREIYGVVEELLRQDGYEALTMDQIAAASHASKATLYRRWNTKAELVITAIRMRRPMLTRDIDTGTLAGDLLTLVRDAGSRLNEEAPLLRGLGQAMHQNPDLLAAFRDQVVLPERAGLEVLLRRAEARGELPEGSAGSTEVVYMLLGAVIGRPILEEKDPDTDFLVRFTHQVILPALRLTP
ncbi:TetR/AcrR family transcriptional regulator [Streptomyces mayteni]